MYACYAIDRIIICTNILCNIYNRHVAMTKSKMCNLIGSHSQENAQLLPVPFACKSMGSGNETKSFEPITLNLLRYS